jgi:hypothetical protein
LAIVVFPFVDAARGMQRPGSQSSSDQLVPEGNRKSNEEGLLIALNA